MKIKPIMTKFGWDFYRNSNHVKKAFPIAEEVSLIASDLHIGQNCACLIPPGQYEEYLEEVAKGNDPPIVPSCFAAYRGWIRYEFKNGEWFEYDPAWYPNANFYQKTYLNHGDAYRFRWNFRDGFYHQTPIALQLELGDV